LKCVVRLPDSIEEAGQSLALDQVRGADRHRGQQLEQLLDGAGLELEEPLEVAAVVVRPDGARDRPADLVQAGQPGDRTGHGELLVFSS